MTGVVLALTAAGLVVGVSYLLVSGTGGLTLMMRSRPDDRERTR